MLRRVKKRTVQSEAVPQFSSSQKRDKRPLGAKKSKDAEERQLMTKVFGGEESFLEALTSKSHKQPKRNKKSARVAELNADLNASAKWEDEDDSKTDLFEKLSGKQKWATLPSLRGQSPDSDDSDVDEIVRSTGSHFVTSSALSPNFLEIARCPNANTDSPQSGRLTSVRFHPTAQVVMTASTDQSLKFFQVDGRNNPKIQNVLLENFPVMSAEFSKGGEEVVMGSKHRSFYFYDMIAGQVVFVPKVKGLAENNMARLRVTPDHRFIVFLGSAGNLHLFSATTKEWIHTLHMNGAVADVTFSSDSKNMFATGDDGKVYVFDLHTRQCVHDFFDDGCINGTAISLSPDSQYLACGSSHGLVNIYDRDTCLRSRTPRPLKVLTNLTTAISATAFNHNAEILALTSDLTEKAVKLVHFPSFTVFANFPEMNDTKIRIPLCVDFSRNSGYMAVGNHKGQALLYSLKHYNGY